MSTVSARSWSLLAVILGLTSPALAAEGPWSGNVEPAFGPTGIEQDDAGNVYVAGGFAVGADPQRGGGDLELLVAQYDGSTGVRIFKQEIRTVGTNERFRGIAVSKGTLGVSKVAKGAFRASTPFILASSRSGSREDILVCGTGWKQRIEGATAGGIASDSDGVYVVGTQSRPGTGDDVLVVKLRPSDGVEIWRQYFSSDAGRGASDKGVAIVAQGRLRRNPTPSSGDGLQGRFPAPVPGPVLGTQRRLYVTGVMGGKTRTLALDPATGSQRWAQDCDGAPVAIEATVSGDVVVGGNHGESMYAVRYTDAGAQAWRTVVPGKGILHGVVIAPGGATILGGEVAGSDFLKVVRLSASGAVEWNQTPLPALDGVRTSNILARFGGVGVASGGDVYVAGVLDPDVNLEAGILANWTTMRLRATDGVVIASRYQGTGSPGFAVDGLVVDTFGFPIVVGTKEHNTTLVVERQELTPGR